MTLATVSRPLTSVQRKIHHKRPDLPAKGYLTATPLDQLSPQERQVRAVLRGVQEYRWQLRKAEPGSADASRYAKLLDRAYERWQDLYFNWVPGPSGYRPKPISKFGNNNDPDAGYDPPPIPEFVFVDPLPPT